MCTAKAAPLTHTPTGNAQVLSRCGYNKSEHVAMWLLVRCDAILAQRAQRVAA